MRRSHITQRNGASRMPLVGDGAARQYTVGKPGGDADAAPETIPWDEGRRSTEVLPHQVFTADEAADVFGAYFRTGEVGAPYVLRRRDDV